MFRITRTAVRLIPTAVFAFLFYVSVAATQSGDVYTGLGYAALATIPIAVMSVQVRHVFKQ